MPTIEGAGVSLAYVEQGRGRRSCSYPRARLRRRGAGAGAPTRSPGARVIAYDRRGYGSSGAPEPYAATTRRGAGRGRRGAAARARTPRRAVVCGDGFGALVALDLAKRHLARRRASWPRNPPLFALVPEATEVLSAQRAELEQALREGGPRRASRRGWAAASTARRSSARGPRTARFFADYAGLATWPVARRELRALDLPAVVLTGPWSPDHVAAAADALAALLPRVTRAQDGDLAAAVRSLL